MLSGMYGGKGLSRLRHLPFEKENGLDKKRGWKLGVGCWKRKPWEPGTGLFI